MKVKRPTSRHWSTNKYDPRVQGKRQGLRQTLQGLHTVKINGFSIMQTDSSKVGRLVNAAIS